MNKLNKPTATEARRAIADFIFGTDEEIEAEVLAMSDEEVEAELADEGISIEPSNPELMRRLNEARENLRQRIACENED